MSYKSFCLYLTKIGITVPVVIKKVAPALAAFLMTISTFANPVLDHVGAGNVSIQQGNNQTVINQGSQKAIINWRSFNIGKGESTHFQQPTGGVALNRISPTQGASQIYGSLSATGKIILINPAGIYFGPSAVVNVGGLIATTANMTDENFLQGNYRFDKVPGYNGAIVNEGQIIAANNGLVALMASNVVNNGHIEANLGHVVLASGEAFTMDFAGDNLINFAVNAKTSSRGVDKDGNELRDGVSNKGTILADGGKVLVSAKAAAGVLDNVINMEGFVQARSVSQNKQGEIIFSGDTQSGVVRVASKIDASGKNASEKGGNVTVTGYNILLDSPTNIDVSGDIGGGNIFIGGNYKGQGPLPNANATVMAPGTSLVANAITSGNGGNIILWADDVTKVYGNISATGGAQSGDGGFVETSGKNYLDVAGIRVDTRAPYGNIGTWLLDPRNVNITTTSPTSGGSFSGANPNVFTPNADDANVYNVDVQNNLATANVTINTGSTGAQAGIITVSAPITWTSANTLLLDAANNIVINAAISGVNGSLNLRAGAVGNTITTGASGTIDVANFNLLRGTWSQISGTLPAFNVRNNFQINSGSMGRTANTVANFIRALSGSGTSGSPYLIADIYGLQGLGSTQTTLGSAATLNNNIDASATATWNSGAGFAPIGVSEGGGNGAYFANFDGQNYTIDNLFINRSSTNTGVGLFGFLSAGATNTIQRVGVTNANVTGGAFTGILAGIVTQANVNNSYTTGTVAGNQNGQASYGTGGLVGSLNSPGVINRSYSAANVSSLNSQNSVGGLVGGSSGTVNNSYAYGTVTGASSGFTGGLVGANGGGTINSSYSSGAVTAAGGSIGGLVGAGGTTNNSFWDTQTSGQASSAGGTGRTTAQMQSFTTYNAAGWSITGTPSTTSTAPSTTWFMFDGFTRPLLMAEFKTTISNAHQLQLMGSTLGAAYTLASNINLASSFNNSSDVWGTSVGVSGAGFVPIASPSTNFTGSLNGQNFILSNLYINQPTGTNMGLFNVIGSAGSVSNLGIESASVTGLYDAGILFGENSGTVTAVHTTGSVTASGDQAGSNNFGIGGLGGLNSGTISNSYNTASISATDTSAGQGTLSVGGLVGINSGTISNSFNSGTVTGNSGAGTGVIIGGFVGLQNGGTIQTSYNIGTASNTSNLYVGGFAGLMQAGTITNSYASGNVFNISSSISGGFVASQTGGAISNSYSTSYVSGTGGFSGNFAGGTVTNSYWDIDTSGQIASASGTGLTTSQMFTQSNYTGWDFVSTWGIIDGSSYPYLRAFYATTPRAISGSSGAAPNSTVNLAIAGSTVATATTAANGAYYYLLGNNSISGVNNSIADSTPLLLYLSGNAVKANAVSISPTSGGSITNANLLANTIQLGDSTTSSITNATLSTAKGALSSTDILYSLSGNNLTLGNATNTTANLISSATTTYTINGTIAPTSGGSGNITLAGPTTINTTSITTNGTQSYNGAVTLGADLALTSGSNAISFGSTLTGASNTLSLQDASSTGGVTFNGNVTLAGLTTFAGNYAVILNGSSNTITNAMSFLNTGGVTLGNGSDTFTFNGGLTSTAGTTTLGGTIATSNDAISLAAVSLAADSTLSSGSAAIGISGAVSGASNTLALQDNTAGSTGTVTFSNNVTLGGLTTFGQAYDVVFNGGTNTFTNAVTFNNTNGVTLGNGGDAFTFDGGLTSTASTTTLSGTLASSNDAITLGTLSLGADSTISSGSGAISLGLINDAARTLTLQDNTAGSTGTVTFSNNVTLAGLTTFGQAYGVVMNGSSNTFTNAVNFLNTNGVTLGDGSDAFTFNGGLTSTAGTTTLGGTVATSNDAISLAAVSLAADSTLSSGSAAIGVSGAVSGASNTLALQDNTAGSTGTITFDGNVTLAGLTTFGQAYGVVMNGSSNTFTNAVNFLNTNGVTLGNGSDAFTFNGGLTSTASTTTLGGTIATSNDAISLAAVSLAADSTLSSGSAAIGISGVVSGASNTLALQDNTAGSTGTVTFSNNVTLGGLTTFGQAYGVVFNGGTNTFTNAVTFNNTNGVTLGNGGDAFAFNGGLTSTASTTTLSGTLASSNDAISLGTLSLGTDSTISSGSGAISLGLINDAARTLTLQDNTAGSTGTVTFSNNVTLAGLTTFAQAYGVVMNGSSNTFTNAVNFLNTNGVTLGDGSDAFTFNGGLTSTAGTTTLGGTIATSNDAISLGAINFASNSTLTSGSGAINISGAVSGASNTLSLQDNTAASTGSVTFDDNVTLAGLTTFGNLSNYAVIFNGSTNSFTNAIQFNSSNGVTLGNGGDAFTFNGGLTSTASTTTLGGTIATSNDAISLGAVNLASNATLLSGSANTIISGAVSGTSNTLTLQDNTAGSTGSVTFNNNVTLAGLTTFGRAYSVIFNGSTNTFTNAVTFLNTSGVTLGNGGDSFTFNGGLTRTSGATTLNGSIATSNDAISLAAVTLGGASTLLAGSATIGISGIVSGAGNTLSLQDASSTGNVTFSTTVTLGGLTTFGGNYGITFNGNGTFTNAVTFNNLGGITLNNGRTLNFNGGMTNTAGGTAMAGTINSTNNTVTLSNLTLHGTTNFNLGNLNVNNTIAGGGNILTINVTDTTGVLAGVISSLSLQKGGAGTLTMSATNTYSSGTVVSAGMLQANNATNPFGTGQLQLNGGTIQSLVNTTLGNSGFAVVTGTTGTITGVNNITINNGGTLTGTGALNVTNTSGTVTLNGNISGTGSITQNGIGGTLLLSGASTYAGNTTLTNGTLLVGTSSIGNITSGSLGVGTLVLNGGTLAANSNDLSFANTFTLGGNAAIGGTNNLALNGNGTLGSGNTLSVTNIGTTTLGGTLSGAGNLSQSAGTLVVSGSNNYSGATTLTSGTLQANNATNAFGTGVLNLNGGTLSALTNATLGNSSFVIGSGATASIGGTNNIILSNAGSFGNSSSALSITNTAGTITLSGILSGDGAITQNGTGGTLLLNAANTYTGGTTLTNGSLSVGNNSALGSGTFALNGGSLLANTSDISIANTFTLGGNAAIGGTNNLALNGNGTLGSGNTLSVTNIGTTTLGGTLSGAGNLSQSAGTLVVSGSNSYSGTTTLTSGTLQANNATNAFGTGILNLNGGTLQSLTSATLGNSSFVIGSGATASIGGTNNIILSNAGSFGNSSSALSITNTAGTITLSGILSGDGALTQNGTGGTLLLNAANTYTGGTTLTNGSLSAGNNSALGSGTFAFNGGSLLANTSGISIANTFTLGGNAAISGTNNLALNGNGTLGSGNTLSITNIGTTTLGGTLSGAGNLSQSAGTLVVSGSNNYSGATTLTSGTLQANNATNAFGTGILNLNGGTLQSLTSATLGNSSFVIGSGATASIGGTNNIILSNAGSFGNSSSALSITNTAGTITLSGILSGDGAITQNGTGGTLLLNAANTYTGGTTLTNGSLSAGNNSALGSGTFALNGGSLLANTSGISIANTFTLGGNAAIGGSNNLALNGNGTLGSGNTLSVTNIGTTTLGGTLSGAGNLSQSAGTLVVSGSNSYSGTTTLTSGTLQANNATNAFGTGILNLNGGTLQSLTSATLGNSSFAIGSGATATIGGTNNITLSNAGSFGNSSSALSITNTAGTITLSGILSGDGALTQNGTGGTLLLNAANTYTGGTTLTNGSLSAGNNSALGSGTFALNGGSLLANTSGISIANTFTLGGNAAIGGSNNLALNGNGTLGSGNTLSVTNLGTTTLGGTLSGAGNLSQSAGILVVSGSNNYSGATTLTSGTLQANNATNAFGTGILNLNGGTLQSLTSATLGNSSFAIGSGATATIGGTNNITLSNAGSFGNSSSALSITNTAGTITLSGILSGDGALTQNGTGGTLLLNAANTYTGGTTLTNGSLSAGNNSALGSGTFALNGGSLLANTSGISIANTFTLGGNAAIGGSNNLALNGNGTLGSGNTLSVSNSGSTTLGGNLGGAGNINQTAGQLTLSGNSTYSGTTTSSATLNLASVGALGNTTAVSVTNGTLNIIGVTLNSNAPIALSNSTLASTGNAGLLGNITLANGTNNIFASNTASNTLLINGILNGASNLTLQGVGDIRFNNNLGANTALSSITSNANAVTFAGTSVNTSGNQTYNSDTTLAQDMNFTSTAGSLAFAVIDGAFDLATNSADTTTFDSAITNLGSLTATGTTIALNNGSISTTGAQSYNGTLDLGATGNLTGSSVAVTNGISGNQDLNINASSINLNGSLALNAVDVVGTGVTNSFILNTGSTQNWAVTGADVGQLTGTAGVSGAFNFSNIQNLTGGSANDSFSLSGGTVSGNISGSGGTNTLAADNVANTWNINSANGGTVTGVGGTFSNIQNLTGGTNNDTYTLDGGSLSGTINGGGGVNSLTADNVANTWNIVSSNAGNVTGVSAFANIQNLTGGNSNNDFVFADNAAITGLVDGGSLSNTNTLNYLAYSTAISVFLTNTNDGSTDNQGGTITNFQNITNVEGDSSRNNSITMPNKSGEVVLTGAYEGYINDPIFFNGFLTFNSLSGNDVVNASVPATINAAAQTVTINGVTMFFNNFNFGTAPSPIPSAPVTSNSFNASISAIIQQPVVNAENMQLLLIDNDLNQNLNNLVSDDYLNLENYLNSIRIGSYFFRSNGQLLDFYIYYVLPKHAMVKQTH